MSDMNIASRIDSYITNFSLPWEKKQPSNKDSYSAVGAIAVYIVDGIDGTSDSWDFTRAWMKTFNSQTNVLCYNEEMEVLFVGLDSGRIVGLTISKDSRYLKY